MTRFSGFVFCTFDSNKYLKKYIKSNLINLIIKTNLIFYIIKKCFALTNQPTYTSELVYIAINSKHQGKGLAGELIKFIEKEFMANKVFEYFLQVYSTNEKAVNFYKKQNFHTFARIKRGDKIKIILRKTIN